MGLLETRHRIVHRHLPALVELQDAAKESLDWLWEWYWGQLDHAFALSKDDEDSIPTGTAREGLNVILKTYVKERKNEIKARHRDSKAADAAMSSYNLKFAANETFGSSTKTRSLLLKLLIDEKMILPADRKIGSSMSGAFLIWSPFLTTLCVTSSETCTISAMINQLIQVMNAPPMFQTTTRNKEMDPLREGMHGWLAHILTSDEWKPVLLEQGSTMMEEVLASCFSEPTCWNLKLAATLLDAYKTSNHEQWQAILEAATSDTQAETEDNARPNIEFLDGNHAEVMSQGPSDTQSQDKESDKVVAEEKYVGPRKFVGLWRPRPIGWIEGLEDSE